MQLQLTKTDSLETTAVYENGFLSLAQENVKTANLDLVVLTSETLNKFVDFLRINNLIGGENVSN